MFKQRKNSCLFLTCALIILSASLSAQVIANFSGSPVRGCAPLIVSFTNLSTGGPTSYTWNLGNGTPSVLPNPATTYTAPGVYSVTLTASNGGSTNTIVKPNYIVVYNPPVPDFTASSYTVCIGQTVTFTDATIISGGAPPIANWAWDFADGNSLNTTTNTVSHAYTSAGNYPVSVIINDTNGCTTNKVKTITVVAPPNASFTASPMFACTAPLNVNFTNTSTSSGAVTYSWNFGNGNTSTLQNPVSTYTAAGSYPVTLVVSQGGCVDSIKVANQIVIQNINVSFAATPSVVCSGQSVTFTNTSVGTPATANWNFGDGNTSTTISPAHTYTAAGTYTVSLSSTDANSCSGNATGVITVNQTPVADFIGTPTVSCSAPLLVTFTNTSTGGSTYSWNFGDGNSSAATNPTHSYNAPGIYNVTLLATNASGTCTDSVVKNSYIMITPPVANFTASPDSGCVPLNVTFTSSSSSPLDPITSYTWTYGDGNSGVTATGTSSNTYTTAGVFTSTLVIQTSTGCRDTFVCNGCVKTGNPPIANFILANDTVCYGLMVNVTDSSQNATGWQYIWGDGAVTTNLPNATHVYGDTGTFQIKLVVYNNGCADTSVIKKVVILPPKAVMSFSLSCTNYFTVNFFSQSIGADSLVWDFGDGSIDSSNNTSPVHTYTATGIESVTITAYNYATGCSNSTSLPFIIAQPIASYSIPSNQGCYAFNAAFTSTSQDASSYNWNFGELTTVNDTSSTANPSYVYNLPGAYTVSLIITDINGCQDSVKGIIKSLGPLPYFYSDTLGGCRPLPVTFVDTTISDSVLVQWTWDFGDGTIVTTTNDSITHVYVTPGIYNVTMSVRDTNGCTKTIVKSNLIQPTFPYPAFTLDTFACRGDLLTFDASTTNAVGPHYNWNFGDGTIVNTTNPVTTHSYSVDNYYSVSLMVTDTNGCDSTIIYKVRILKPTANFSWNILNAGCGTLQVAFQDSSQGFVTNYNWDFGNGATSTLQSPNYTYLQPGVYNASLIVTNAGGCKDTIQKDSIIVVPGPVGTFSFSPINGCNPLSVTFVGNSSNAQQYIWDFGDGYIIPGNDSIVHVYTTQGVFNPILSLGDTLADGSVCLLPATNLTGLVTVTSVINVSVSPNILVLPQDSIGATIPGVSGGVLPYISGWSPNNGYISCGSCPIVSVMGSGDTLMYIYTAIDQSGCAGSDTLWVYSHPCLETAKIPNVFSPNGDANNEVFYIPGVCPSEEFNLEIFDRWGSRLFNSVSRNHGWDGKTDHGQDAPEGTYYFIVKVKDTGYRGFLQLVR